MSGLLRRLTRRRPATADETRSLTPESSETAGAPAETPAEPGGGQPVPASDEQATQALPVTAEQTVVEPAPAPPVRDLPAGIDPGELAAAPAPSGGRSRLRRRVRYLRRVRELLLRDLGGFMFEIHRSAGGTAQEGHRRLIDSKASRIAAVDAELHALEDRLGESHGGTVLREPGIGGLCPECGELHASDAHYCARCGAPLDAKARAKRDAAIAEAAKPVTQTTPAPAPSSVLWAAGPRPGGKPPAEEEKSEPSAATSQWLALSHHGPADVAATRPAPKDEEPAVEEKPAEEPPAESAEPAKPKRARTRKPKPEAPTSENGKRDEDVAPPAPDPLASRPEPGP
jgi:hypothetical protein